MRRCAPALVGLLLATWPQATLAEPARYGIFVGSNAAPEGREPLRHAEADASRLRRVFIELGGMSELDAVLLESPSASQILDAIGAFQRRLRGQEAVFVFYYSGHADDRALLLGGSELSMARLKARLDRVPARLGLHLLDSCRSGALTRLKGASLGRPFSVHSTPVGEGKVIITSSAEWEDSQESDRLEGSFFSVHLASGLRGAADADADGRVTLAEAYRYVYSRTIESTLATRAGPQHPTFLYDIRGRGDWILTWSDVTSALGTLLLSGEGDYLVIEGTSGRVVAEVRPRTTGERLRLKPGEYRVSKRTSDELWEGTIRLGPDQAVIADRGLTTRTTHARLVRKGGGGQVLSHSLWAEAGLRGPLGHGIEASPLLRLAYGLNLPWLSFRPHLGLGGGLFGVDVIQTPRLAYELDELSFGLEIRRDFDFPWFTAGAGLVVDGLYLTESEIEERERRRATFGFVLGAVAGIQSRPLYGFALRILGELDTYSFLVSSAHRGPAEESDLETVLTYRALIALGVEL